MRKRCHRKVRTLINPLTFAMAGARPPPDEKLKKIELQQLSALQSLASGSGKVDDVRFLSEALAFIETLNDGRVRNQKIRVTVQYDAAPAREAFRSIHERRLRTGRYGVSGLELQVLRELVEAYTDVAQCVIVSDFERVHDHMRAKERSGHVEKLRVPAH